MRYVLLILLLFFILPVTAQTIIVTGRVTDKETNEGIPFANIAFKGSIHGLSTDFDGYFTLELKKTADSLVASCIGYQPKALRVRRTTETQPLNFELSLAVYNKKQRAAITKGETRAQYMMQKVVEMKNYH